LQLILHQCLYVSLQKDLDFHIKDDFELLMKDKRFG